MLALFLSVILAIIAGVYGYFIGRDVEALKYGEIREKFHSGLAELDEYRKLKDRYHFITGREDLSNVIIEVIDDLVDDSREDDKK